MSELLITRPGDLLEGERAVHLKGRLDRDGHAPEIGGFSMMVPISSRSRSIESTHKSAPSALIMFSIVRAHSGFYDSSGVAPSTTVL